MATIAKDPNAEFLVGLSALSSTSNLTATVTKPLDIVLVMDMSGSMGDPLSTEYTYTPVYNVQEPSGIWSQTYYGQDENGEYVEIEAAYEWQWMECSRAVFSTIGS